MSDSAGALAGASGAGPDVVRRFEAVVGEGGIVLFPSDTVYGLCCRPGDDAALARLYGLKGRAAEKPSALMWFSTAAALADLPSEVGPRVREAIARLLPGPVTLIVPGGLGVRVVSVPALTGARGPVIQTSANLSGAPDARRLEDVDAAIRAGVDLAIDGGELPGVASTVVDLLGYEETGAWSVLRLGAVDGDELHGVLGGRFHFHPATYVEMLRADLPEYDELQDRLVDASWPASGPAASDASGRGSEPMRILELGTGMGETAARLLAAHPGAALTGVDEDAEMLDAAHARLGPSVDLRTGLLQDPLPAGPFDLVASALCVHHLDGTEKADLFRRLRAVLAPGGRFVLADVVLPVSSGVVTSGVSDGYDKPSTVAEQVRWLADAGFADVSVAWEQRDLAVIVAA